MLLFVNVFKCDFLEHGGYVMLAIAMFALVYSLTISEVAVTFPDTSCFIPC